MPVLEHFKFCRTSHHKHYCLLAMAVPPRKNKEVHTPKGNLTAQSRAGWEAQPIIQRLSPTALGAARVATVMIILLSKASSSIRMSAYVVDVPLSSSAASQSASLYSVLQSFPKTLGPAWYQGMLPCILQAKHRGVKCAGLAAF